MGDLRLRIGGHVVAIQGDNAVRFWSGYEGSQRFVDAGSEPEFVIRFGQPVKPWENVTVLSRFSFSENNSRCEFSRSNDNPNSSRRCYQYTMSYGEDAVPQICMHYEEGSKEVLASDCSDSSMLRFSTWFAYSMLLAPLGITFVHSSVIVYRERAILFLGESGTGKSTHTRLWMKNIENAHLLNDDSPVIKVENGFPVIYGSPWSGKTPCYYPYKFPLAAVIRLSQAPHNKIIPLSIPRAFAALQPSLPPALMQDDRFADMMIDILSGTVGKVPFYHLECLPDADAAKLSCKTVFGKE